MDINGSSRSQLKTYFIKHAIPSEGEFSELIDGMLNQRDDRIIKPPDGPLSLEAAGDAASRRQVLHLYESFDDANPTWVLTMNPRSTVSDPATAKRGLSIDDASGVSRLFVDHATGQVGIGTLEPQAALHVDGDIICSGRLIPAPPETGQWEAISLTTPKFSWIETYYNLSRPQPSAFKDPVGVVHLRGYIGASSSIGPGEVIGTLPAGHWPDNTLRIVVFTHHNGHDDITIQNDGQIMSGHNLHQDGFTLDGISFPVGIPMSAET
ncbi:MAG: hypothetical protein AAGF11_00380 [Myxococcota bacterium]